MTAYHVKYSILLIAWVSLMVSCADSGPVLWQRACAHTSTVALRSTGGERLSDMEVDNLRSDCLQTLEKTDASIANETARCLLRADTLDELKACHL